MEAPLVPAGRGGFPRHPSRLFLSPTGLNFCLALSDESANVIYIRWSVRCSVRCDNSTAASAIRALRDPNNVAGEDMGAVSTETIPALERGDVFGCRLERSQSSNDTAPVSLTASPPDALVSAKLQLAETDAVAIARAERIIADAQTTARDIIAEAERAAQDLVARAIKIQAEADRALDDAKSKAVCIQKRAQAALALAENIAEGRRLIDALSG